MRKKLFWSCVLIVILLVSCSNKYSYIETVEEEDLTGTLITKHLAPRKISAPTDSAAYCKAYMFFCMSQQVANEMKLKYEGIYNTNPISFKLLDDEGKDISNTVIFSTQAQREKEIHNRIFSRESTTDTLPKLTPVSNNTVIHEEDKVLGDIEFGMSEQEAKKEISAFQKHSIKAAVSSSYYIGNYQYYYISDAYYKNKLYSLEVHGAGISRERYDEDIMYEVQNVVEILTRRFGLPKTSYPIKEQDQMENGHTYLVKAWSIGSKRIEVNIEDAGIIYYINLKIFQPAIEEILSNESIK